MPEGDTVWLSAKQMHVAFAGRVLTKSDFRVPRYATYDFSGRTVHEVASRGKHMLTHIDGDWTIHTHFGMDGAWRLSRGARSTRHHAVRLVLANDEWTAIGTSLKNVDVLRTRDEHRLVGHLGPDLLGPNWDLDEAVRRLRAQPDREIGDALLDQRNLAGIGNLYRSEVLFIHGIAPGTKVCDVDALANVVETAHQLLTDNRERWAQVTTGNARRGCEHWVYERTRRPCLRCGTPIRSMEQLSNGRPRFVYWCPRCQV